MMLLFERTLASSSTSRHICSALLIIYEPRFRSRSSERNNLQRDTHQQKRTHYHNIIMLRKKKGVTKGSREDYAGGSTLIASSPELMGLSCRWMAASATWKERTLYALRVGLESSSLRSGERWARRHDHDADDAHLCKRSIMAWLGVVE